MTAAGPLLKIGEKVVVVLLVIVLRVEQAVAVVRVLLAGAAIAPRLRGQPVPEEFLPARCS